MILLIIVYLYWWLSYLWFLMHMQRVLCMRNFLVLNDLVLGLCLLILWNNDVLLYLWFLSHFDIFLGSCDCWIILLKQHYFLLRNILRDHFRTALLKDSWALLRDYLTRNNLNCKSCCSPWAHFGFYSTALKRINNHLLTYLLRISQWSWSYYFLLAIRGNYNTFIDYLTGNNLMILRLKLNLLDLWRTV